MKWREAYHRLEGGESRHCCSMSYSIAGPLEADITVYTCRSSIDLLSLPTTGTTSSLPTPETW